MPMKGCEHTKNQLHVLLKGVPLQGILLIPFQCQFQC